MSTLVILKFGSGSLASGFPVTLQLGPEGAQPYTERSGSLPADPRLQQAFEQWQGVYRRFDFSGAAAGRPIALPKSAVQPPGGSSSQDPAPPAFSSLEACNATAIRLAERLNDWLRSEDFLPLRETWLAKLPPTEPLRVVVQTQALELQRLPWHQWELVQRSPQAAVTLCAPHYDRPRVSPRAPGPVQLLAILGDSQGIDLARDRALIAALPGVEATFLIEPSREQLTDQLWQSPWQVLFFAGHSASFGPEAVGRMAINPHDSLTIGELKYALRNAVGRGLKLAIFNSCDGLGLARELADLQISQLIVMAEPVPDPVAQHFLTAFLAGFTQGLPLHLAVRQARAALVPLSQTFPCAPWLPMVFQSLAETPPDWAALVGADRVFAQPSIQPSHQIPEHRIGQTIGETIATTPEPADLERSGPELSGRSQRRSAPQLLKGLGLALAVGAAVIGARAGGLFQALELRAYDLLLSQQPPEALDPHLLVITITEADLAIQADRSGGSLSDAALLQVLEALDPHGPAVIGLDIYRDRPVAPAYPALASWLAQDDRFVGVCRISDGDRDDIAPPPEVSLDRIGFSDLIPDDDGIHRRHLLALTPPPTSVCQTQFAMGTLLALRYLGAMHKIVLEPLADGRWQLGQASLAPLDAPIGGYQRADTWGYQILLNYRNPSVPHQVAPQLTLAQVLRGEFEPAQIKDRLVIIGTTAESFKDYARVPGRGKNAELAGVLLQAQMASQLVNAALGTRSPVQIFPVWLESGWIVLHAGLGGVMALVLRRRSHLLIGLGLGIAAIGALSVGLWLQASLWLTSVPAMAALGTSALGVRVWKQSHPSEPP